MCWNCAPNRPNWFLWSSTPVSLRDLSWTLLRGYSLWGDFLQLNGIVPYATGATRPLITGMGSSRPLRPEWIKAGIENRWMDCIVWSSISESQSCSGCAKPSPEICFSLFSQIFATCWDYLLLLEYELNSHGDMGRFPLQSLYGKNIFLFWWKYKLWASALLLQKVKGLSYLQSQTKWVLIMHAWWLA